MSNDEAKVLTKLLTRIVDSAKGYEDAGEDAKGGQLAELFSRRAATRRQFAAEIRAEITRLGEDADDDGSLLAAAHRLFMDLKAKFSDSNEAVLEEVERGESALVEQYEETLDDLPVQAFSRGVVSRQLAEVRKDLATARAMEKSM